jgi:hypothetical protein
MEIKDWLLFLGVPVTFIIGIANLWSNLITSKRTAFVNTVTSERIKRISKFRENISSLCALCDQWMLFRTQENSADLQHRIAQLRNEIRLQLNLNDFEDKDIESLLAKLPSWTQSMTPEVYLELQQKLVTSAQSLLSKEWDKVKDESVYGDLRHNWWQLRRRWRPKENYLTSHRYEHDHEELEGTE